MNSKNVLTSTETVLAERKLLSSSSVVLPICGGYGKVQLSNFNLQLIHSLITKSAHHKNTNLHTPEEAGTKVQCSREKGKELDHAHPRWRDVEFLGHEAGCQYKHDSE
jgi:hypothetical protein